MIQSAIEFFIRNNVSIIQIGFAIIFFLAVFVILKSFRENKNSESTLKPIPRKSYKEEMAPPPPPPKSLGKEDSNPLDDLDNLDDLMAMDEKVAAAPASTTAATASATATAPAGAATATAAPAAAPTAPTTAPVPSPELQKAIEEKEKLIADLKKEMTSIQEQMQNKGDTSALEQKIKELSEKLSEYEIIEDDIANLSFYKNENTKLKNELEKIKGGPVNLDSPSVAPEAPAEKNEPVLPPPTEASAAAKENSSVLEEFEKAVQQKDVLEKNMQAHAEPAAPAASVAAAPATTNTVGAESAIEVDSKKLVQEMESLAQSPAPAAPADDGKDSTQKLIEEFESFMNKASS